MEELRGIRDLVHPNETLLVIDSMTGQDAVNVAQSFDSGLGVDGVILTKLDGDTRGGAALSLSRPGAARLWRLSESAALLPFLAAAACSWRLPGSAALFLFLLRPSAPGIRPARPEASASLSYLSRSVPSPATSTSTPQALLMALWALWVCTASTSASTTKVAPS